MTQPTSKPALSPEERGALDRAIHKATADKESGWYDEREVIWIAAREYESARHPSVREALAELSGAVRELEGTPIEYPMALRLSLALEHAEAALAEQDVAAPAEPLIERLRKDVAGMLRGEYDDPERADQVDIAADALARLSAQPDVTAIYGQCAKIALDTPDQFGTLADDSHKECALVAARLISAAGKHAAQPATREWIPVAERLPTHVYSVLGLVTRSPNHQCDADDPMAAVCSYLQQRETWVMGDGPGDVDIDVSHWMPLPEPPHE